MAEQDKDQRTEQATPRRRMEAREQGQVPLSLELVAALLLVTWTGALAMGGGPLVHQLASALFQSFQDLGSFGRDEITTQSVATLIGGMSWAVGRSLLLLIAPILAIGALVAYLQVGFLITPKAIAFDVSKLDPLRGLQRLISPRSGVRTLQAAFKILFISAAMTWAAGKQVGHIAALAGSETGPVLAGIGYVALRCIAAALLAILVLALVDAGFQRWQHERDLRMSRQEIREELRNLDGDPHIKARIRRVQREMAARRQMAEVPKATVVVTNPTHYAVALRYARDEGPGRAGGAPRVVAKGVDHVAVRIKELARESGVLCYEDVPLARALHARCELGDEIPVDLYAAVAEVLAYVYRLQGIAVGAPAT